MIQQERGMTKIKDAASTCSVSRYVLVGLKEISHLIHATNYIVVVFLHLNIYIFFANNCKIILRDPHPHPPTTTNNNNQHRDISHYYTIIVSIY